jgi:hypothetical protein
MGSHTLFTGQLEREIERDRECEREKREKEGGREKYVQNCFFKRNEGCLGTFW